MSQIGFRYKKLKVNFCWIPSYISIQYYSWQKQSIYGCKISTIGPDSKLYRFKMFIKLHTNSFWRIFWNIFDRNDLYCIQNNTTNHVASVLNVKTKLSFQLKCIWTFKLILLKRGQQPECTFGYCPLTKYFSGEIRQTSLVVHAVGLCPQNVGS